MELTEVDIVKRVMEIFSVYGVRSLSMDNIAQHVPVAKRKLLRIAKNKEDLVRSIFEYCITRYKELRQQILQNCAPENEIDEMLQHANILHKISNEFNSHLEFEFRKYYPEIYAEYTDDRDGHMKKTLQESIERGKTQGVYKKELDSKLALKEILVEAQQMKAEFEKVEEEIIDNGKAKEACHHIAMKFLLAMFEKLTNEVGKEFLKKRLGNEKFDNTI